MTLCPHHPPGAAKDGKTGRPASVPRFSILSNLGAATAVVGAGGAASHGELKVEEIEREKVGCKATNWLWLCRAFRYPGSPKYNMKESKLTGTVPMQPGSANGSA